MRPITARPLLPTGLLAILFCSSAALHAQPADVAAALAELKAENARLAQRISELEEQIGNNSGAASGQSLTVQAATSGRPDRALADSRVAQRPSPFVDTDAYTPRLPIVAGPSDKPVQRDGAGIELNASSSGGQVAIVLARNRASTRVDLTKVHGVATSWSITAAAPVDKGGSDTMLATLDGFTNSSSLKLRIGQFHLTMPNVLSNPRYLQLEEAADAHCVAEAKGDRARIQACDDTDPDIEYMKKHLSPEQLAEFREMVTRVDAAWGYGIEGSVGYQKYSFVDALALKKAESEKTPWGIKGFWSIIPGPNVLLTGSLAYQHAYKESSAATICPVVTTGTSVKCLTGANGAPLQQDKVLVAVEGRKLVSLDGTWLENEVIGKLGISGQLTYDAKNDDFGVDLPIYLAADDKGKLIGGVRFGYKTAGKDDFIGGVFVGSAFDIFK